MSKTNLIVRRIPFSSVSIKKLYMLIVVTLTLLVNAPAFSAENSTSNSSDSSHDLYVGLSLGLMDRDDTPADELFTNEGLIFPNGATRFFVGYRINDNLSVEIGYDDIDNVSGTDTVYYNGVFTDYPYTIIIEGIDISALYRIDIRDRTSAYAKAGLVIMHTKLYNKHFFGPPTDIEETNILPLVGGGVDYLFTQNFSLGLFGTYMNGTNSTPTIKTYGLKGSYAF